VATCDVRRTLDETRFSIHLKLASDSDQLIDAEAFTFLGRMYTVCPVPNFYDNFVNC